MHTTITGRPTLLRPVADVGTTHTARPARCRRSDSDGAAGLDLVGGGPADSYRRVVPLGRPAVPAPNYPARRAAAVVLALLTFVAGGLAVEAMLTSLGGAPASAAGAPSATPLIGNGASARHVAQPGDTLWSIAAEHRGAIAHDSYLDALIRLNGGTRIEVGQAVRLP